MEKTRSFGSNISFFPSSQNMEKNLTMPVPCHLNSDKKSSCAKVDKGLNCQHEDKEKSWIRKKVNYSNRLNNMDA